jgi:hypothetical protein
MNKQIKVMMNLKIKMIVKINQVNGKRKKKRIKKKRVLIHKINKILLIINKTQNKVKAQAQAQVHKKMTKVLISKAHLEKKIHNNLAHQIHRASKKLKNKIKAKITKNKVNLTHLMNLVNNLKALSNKKMKNQTKICRNHKYYKKVLVNQK